MQRSPRTAPWMLGSFFVLSWRGHYFVLGVLFCFVFRMLSCSSEGPCEMLKTKRPSQAQRLVSLHWVVSIGLETKPANHTDFVPPLPKLQKAKVRSCEPKGPGAALKAGENCFLVAGDSLPITGSETARVRFGASGEGFLMNALWPGKARVLPTQGLPPPRQDCIQGFLKGSGQIMSSGSEVV